MRVHSIFLHLMRSLSEYLLRSTLRVRPSHRMFYPDKKEVCCTCMQCVHKCAWEDASSCRGPVRADRMPMAFVNVRLRAQRGPRCICSTWSCGSSEMQ